MYFSLKQFGDSLRTRISIKFVSFDLILASRSFRKSPVVRPALFCDLDGTLWPDMGYGTIMKEPKVNREAISLLNEFRQKQYLRIGFSNQTLFGYGDKSVNSRVWLYLLKLKELVDCGLLDAISICHHHPNSKLKFLRKECPRRKPTSGLISQFKDDWGVDISNSIAVGDRITDVIAARDAGIPRVFLLLHKYSFELNEDSRVILKHSCYPFDVIDNLSELSRKMATTLQ